MFSVTYEPCIFYFLHLPDPRTRSLKTTRSGWCTPSWDLRWWTNNAGVRMPPTAPSLPQTSQKTAPTCRSRTWWPTPDRAWVGPCPLGPLGPWPPPPGPSAPACQPAATTRTGSRTPETSWRKGHTSSPSHSDLSPHAPTSATTSLDSVPPSATTLLPNPRRWTAAATTTAETEPELRSSVIGVRGRQRVAMTSETRCPPPSCPSPCWWTWVYRAATSVRGCRTTCRGWTSPWTPTTSTGCRSRPARPRSERAAVPKSPNLTWLGSRMEGITAEISRPSQRSRLPEVSTPPDWRPWRSKSHTFFLF